MPDEQKGPDAPTPPPATPAGKTPAGDDWKMEDLPASTQAYIKELRDEAKRTRLEKEAADNARKLAEQQQLVEQGNWKKLAEDRAAELAKLQPYQEQASNLLKIISANNAQMIQQIPEHMRGIVPPLSEDALNAWLVKNLPLLQRKPAPDLNAGEGSGGSGQQPLTEEEKQMAARFGLTPEKFAAQKAKK